MSRHDNLKNTWIYQEIEQEVREEGRQHYLTTQRSMLLEILQARFPRTVPLAKRVSENLDEIESLSRLLVKVSVASSEREARTQLLAIDSENQHGGY